MPKNSISPISNYVHFNKNFNVFSHVRLYVFPFCVWNMRQKHTMRSVQSSQSTLTRRRQWVRHKGTNKKSTCHSHDIIIIIIKEWDLNKRERKENSSRGNFFSYFPPFLSLTFISSFFATFQTEIFYVTIRNLIFFYF